MIRTLAFLLSLFLLSFQAKAQYIALTPWGNNNTPSTLVPVDLTAPISMTLVTLVDGFYLFDIDPGTNMFPLAGFCGEIFEPDFIIYQPPGTQISLNPHQFGFHFNICAIVAQCHNTTTCNGVANCPAGEYVVTDTYNITVLY